MSLLPSSLPEPQESLGKEPETLPSTKLVGCKGYLSTEAGGPRLAWGILWRSVPPACSHIAVAVEATALWLQCAQGLPPRHCCLRTSLLESSGGGSERRRHIP